MLSVIVILRKSFCSYLLLLIIALTSIIELLNKEIKKYKEGFSFQIPEITIEKENKRIARSPNDPFDQQQEDVSAFLLKGSKPFKQEKDILSSQNPEDNEISNNPLRTRGGIPVYPPVSLDGDTLVNDLLLENGRRGGLVRLEPDAELLRQETSEYQI